MSKSEAQTRSELIDQQLAQSGWNVKDPMQVIEEFDIPSALPQGVAEPRTPYEGHQFSDYVLLGKDRKPLAVVEAKKSSKDAAIGREQAKQYCYNIQNQLGGESHSVFIPTDSKRISGIWKTTRRAKSLVSRREMIWSASPISAAIANR